MLVRCVHNFMMDEQASAERYTAELIYTHLKISGYRESAQLLKAEYRQRHGQVMIVWSYLGCVRCSVQWCCCFFYGMAN